MAGPFVGACCRCRFWPCMKGGRGFGLVDPKKSDDDRKEEETHLLATVVESDDEQADALSPDEIRRYLDESRTKGQDHGFTDSGGSRAVQHIGLRSVTSRPQPMQMEVQMHRHGASVPLANEYDELFDEESEDEPESVVVRAKPRAGVAGSNSAGMAEPAASRRRRSPSPVSSPSSSSSWDGAATEVNPPPPGPGTVLQTLAGSPERSSSSSNNDRYPDRLLLDGGNASGGNHSSPGSLDSDMADHAGSAAAAAAKDSAPAPSVAGAVGTGGIDAAAPAVAAATSSTTDAFRKLLEEDDDDDLLDDYEPPVPIARRGGETDVNSGGETGLLDAVCSDDDLL